MELEEGGDSPSPERANSSMPDSAMGADRPAEQDAAGAQENAANDAENIDTNVEIEG